MREPLEEERRRRDEDLLLRGVEVFTWDFFFELVCWLEERCPEW